NHDPQYGFSNLSDKTRNYQFVVTSPSIVLQLDSWSDCYNNVTTVVLPHTDDPVVMRDAIIRSVAHETAICLDSKSNLDRVRFESSPLFDDLVLLDKDSNRAGNSVFTSMSNPVLRYMFGYMRAFKTERLWVSELPAKLGDFSGYYDNDDAFAFMSSGCDTFCILDYIDDKSSVFSIYALPLLNESSYWDSKIFELIPRSMDEQEIDESLDVLFSARRVFQDNFDDRLFFLSLATTEFNSHDVSQMITQAKRVFDQVLIPMDLDTLRSLRVEMNNSVISRDDSVPYEISTSLMQWLSVPQLSNRGAQLSSGPRPRITTLMGTGTSSTTTMAPALDPSLGLLVPKPDDLRFPVDEVETDTQLEDRE
ncbi:MAG: hypothetical protein HRT45_14070, partial [Bdellovibrionales bacterium]|nr:hypothetical protein [Bdellovibrionales bacterium]